MIDDTTIIAKAAKKIRQFGAGPGGRAGNVGRRRRRDGQSARGVINGWHGAQFRCAGAVTVIFLGAFGQE